MQGRARGTQWLADFNECRCAPSLLASARELEVACCQIVGASALNVMGQLFHQFELYGATGLILLAESHLARHTWPEFSSVAIDLYVAMSRRTIPRKHSRSLSKYAHCFCLTTTRIKSFSVASLPLLQFRETQRSCSWAESRPMACLPRQVSPVLRQSSWDQATTVRQTL